MSDFFTDHRSQSLKILSANLSPFVQFDYNYIHLSLLIAGRMYITSYATSTVFASTATLLTSSYILPPNQSCYRGLGRADAPWSSVPLKIRCMLSPTSLFTCSLYFLSFSLASTFRKCNSASTIPQLASAYKQIQQPSKSYRK